MPPKGTAHKVKTKPPRTYAREVDLHEGVFLEPYEDGTYPGGLKAWNAAHEKLMHEFYAGRPLPTTLSNRTLNSFLDEASFASRERGRQVTAESAIDQSIRINAPDFHDKYIQPFEQMSQLEREKTILKALGDEARSWEARGIPYDWQRKLVPEITLEKLCADDGLSSFFSFLNEHLLEPDLTTHPIPNDLFFRKFGISTTEANSFPLSKGARAFAEENVLIRHSFVFMTATTILDTIAGYEYHLGSVVGSVASDLTQENAPHIAEEKDGPDLTEDQLYLQEQRCEWCHRTAAQAGKTKLDRCGGCHKIGRVHPYCSRDCQATDFTFHKQVCGKLLREARGVPLFNLENSAPSAAPLHPYRRAILRSLDVHPNEHWAAVSGGGCSLIGFLNKAIPDAEQMKIRRGLRKVAYGALLDSDPTCIDLVAAVFLPDTGLLMSHPTAIATGRKELDKKALDAFVLRDQFKEMFKLDDKQFKEAVKRGRDEKEKPQWYAVKKLYEVIQITGDRIVDRFVDNCFDTARKKEDSSRPPMPKETEEFMRPVIEGMTNMMLGRDMKKDDCVVS